MSTSCDAAAPSEAADKTAGARDHEIQRLVSDRQQARAEGDFARADALRKELRDIGVSEDGVPLEGCSKEKAAKAKKEPKKKPSTENGTVAACRDGNQKQEQGIDRPQGPRVHVRQSPPRFEAFYRANLLDVGLIKDGEEWERFVDVLNRPLPCTLWITPTAADVEEVRSFLQDCQRRAEAAEAASVGGADRSDGAEEQLRVQPLPWFSNHMGWCVDVPKTVLRKDPVFKPLHNFLIKHTALGTITRQAEDSMLPVAVLGVCAGHRCLDMCAAPGSKTAQLLAALAAANFARSGRGLEAICSDSVRQCRHSLQGRVDYSADEGLVIANDMDTDRLGMLVHQVQRLRSLYPLALFTYHDARFYPTIRTPSGEELRFDRILCDVMCSSDGTLRKEPHMWHRWNVKDSLELHRDQLAIALRAARLLKVGGRMVYSTCSMSPIENEAVVAEILRCTHGSMVLIDGRAAVEPFQFADGLSKWSVAHPKTSQLYPSYASAVAADGGHKLLVPGLFPPEADSEVARVLHKCMRVLPHHNDTGGFFVALLEKVAELQPASAASATPQCLAEDHGHGVSATQSEPSPQSRAVEPRAYDSDADEDGEEVRRVQQLQRLEADIAKGKSEQDRAKALARRERAKKSGVLSQELVRYVPMTEASPLVEASLRETYGLPEEYGASSPGFPMRQLFCRYHLEVAADGSARQPHIGDTNQLVFCARAVADLLPNATGSHAKRKLKIMSGGLRAFQKDHFEMAQGSHYRVAHEMLEFLLPYLRRRVVVCDDPADTKRLLAAGKSSPVKDFASAAQEQLEALGPGGCVLLLRSATPDGDSCTSYIPVSALRTKLAVDVYVSKEELPAVRASCGLPEEDTVSS